MAIQNVQTFDDLMRKYVSEQISQDIAKFNGASNNTIMLAGVTTQGSFAINSFVKDLRANKFRRDPSSTSTLTYSGYQEGEHVVVKIAGGFAIKLPNAVLQWAGEGDPSAEVSAAMTEISKQYSEAVVQDQLNTALLGAGAAIANNSGVTTDVSATAKLTQLGINTMLSKFGDRSGDIKGLVMTGAAYHELIGEAITNANSLFSIGGVAVVNGSAYGQGRPIIVTDAPALAYNDETNDVYKVLGLVQAGIRAGSPKQTTAIETKTDQQNIYSQFLANYEWDQDIKGYSFSKSIPYPADTAIGSGANYTKDVTSDKNTAGVCLIANQVAP